MSKRYRAICWYESIMTNIIPEEADSVEEAREKAEKDFKDWNEKWMKDYNGPEKRLIKIEIQE